MGLVCWDSSYFTPGSLCGVVEIVWTRRRGQSVIVRAGKNNNEVRGPGSLVWGIGVSGQIVLLNVKVGIKIFIMGPIGDLYGGGSFHVGLDHAGYYHDVH